MSITVIEFSTLDGVVHDPDGSAGSPGGGWAFRYGPGPVAGDKFRLGELLETATMLLGRHTWQQFSHLWPQRDDDFAKLMNDMPKLVASRTLDDVSAWDNSSVLEGDLVDEARARSATGDIIVTGSTRVVHQLAAHDLVDLSLIHI